jgi:D-2-hydroxyacid dehydrogenase (NADP+)
VSTSEGAILIVDPYAEWFAERLSESVPEVRIAWTPAFADAGSELEDTRAVVTKGLPGTGPELTPELVARMPRLEWVQGLLAGYDQFVAPLASRPRVVLTTARGIHGAQMSETVLLHMLALGRAVPRFVGNKCAHRWEQWTQPVLDERVVVIVGLGASGAAVARLCSSLGMTVLGVSRTGREVEGVDEIFARAHLEEVAARADFLVVIAAAEPGAPPLVDATVLAAMKPTAYLVNVGRGALVDEHALIIALRGRRIAGAGLDVFTTEPLPADSPFWELDNVFLTPHIGGHSDRYEQRALTVIEHNLRAFLKHRPEEMMNVIDR